MGYVYKITNTVNNKAYIGISIHDPEKDRIRKHLSGTGNRLIANAVKKYGCDSFIYEILEANVFDEFLPELEVAYIANHNTIAPNGYNLDSGGNGAGSPSLQTRLKLSKANKGEKNHNFGKSRPAKVRRKISEALKGRQRPTKVCRKISEAHKGKKRKPLSAEHRSKISEAKKNPSVQTRRKMSEAMKGNQYFLGKSHPVQTRRKMSEAHKGKKNHNFGKPALNRRPEYVPAHEFFLSLSPDMPLKEKRKLLYAKFSSVNKNKIQYWVRKWSS